MSDRLKGMIGLAIKAGRAVSGGFAVQGAVARGKAKLVLVDGRAAPNTVRQYAAMCENNRVPCIVLKEKGLLEGLTSRDNRTVMAIVDGGFAEAIQEILRKE